MAPISELKNNTRVTDFFQPVVKTTNNDEDWITPGPRHIRQTIHPQNPATLSSSQLSALLCSFPSSSLSSFRPLASSRPRVIPSSDGEESSEESDLEDPFTLLSTMEPEDLTMQTVNWNQDQDLPIEAHILPSKPKPSMYQFSLQRLLADRNKASAVENDIKRARYLINPSSEHNGRQSGQAHFILTEDTADAIMGERGTGTRLLDAFDRKEVLWEEKTWTFFDRSRMSINKDEHPFPKIVVTDREIFSAIKDVFVLDQMLPCGMLIDMAVFGESVPNEILTWMLDQVCLEPNEDLAFAYLLLLQVCLWKGHHCLTISKVTLLLELLGAKKDVLNLDRQIQLQNTTTVGHAKCIGFVPDPVQYANLTKDHSDWNIRLLLKLLGEKIDTEANVTQFFFGSLIRIALDDAISRQSDILLSIEGALYNFSCNIAEGEWNEQSHIIGCNILSTILQPQLRVRVLRVLPISSPRWHVFRRRLACAFLFEDGLYLSKSQEQLVHFDKLTDLLRQHQYKIHKDTDYAALQSLISILDIAIDNGATTGTSMEKDKGVDQLIDALRSMFSRIVDTNAQNLARTEAKDTIERLQFRLTFSVRSRQKMALDLDSAGSQSVLNWNQKLSSIVTTGS
ncbi:hypothetical protein BDD12DRAFT_931768 [Trichophaea hybrida]|nr:hypothetical protein BDD12DRAFT_931768 [Trichophaea hybrida]